MGSLVNSLFGKGGSGIAGDAIARARELGAQSVFRPYTVTTGSGSSQYLGDGQYQTTLSEPYQNILGTSLAGASSLFGQLADFDPSRRAQEVFGEQSALLQPEFQRQAIDLQQGLFGSGRLGLRLAGESQGLGAGSGMVQPDALGLGRAQQQTLAGLATQARNQAFGEQAQLGQLASGLLQSGLNISGLEQQLMSQGLDAETARAAAAYASGQMQLSPYSTAAQVAQQQRGQNADFIGGLFGGAMQGYGTYAGLAAAGLPSDVRLKENITHLDTLNNGINVYTWDWNNIAKVMGVDNHPRVGVIAQEIERVIPEAVLKHSNGYLMVDYNHPELQGVH
jgi:hypothetical protein